ncbi:MAG: FHA domain-containing protein, partial [Planctomycetota bacterium]|nr:FHA domain-containing protein [Planctomycetota bacterium]
MPHITILTGPSRGRIIELGPQACRIGRDANIEVPINDAKASRVHVEIQSKEGAYVLRDLRSKNGTMVNGTSVSALTLKEGDQIQIGETRIGFSLQDAPPQHRKGSRGYDSILAARLPEGVVAALGTAGMERSGVDSFETLELNAPLAILGQEAPPAEPPEARPSPPPEDIDATPVPTRVPGLIAATREQRGAQVERANRSLRALYALARSAAEANSTEELWRALSAGLQQALEADRVTPVLIEKKGTWEVAASCGAHSSSARSRAKPAAFSKVAVSRTIVDYALRTRRSVLTAPRSDARFEGARSIGEQGITSALCVPIIS